MSYELFVIYYQLLEYRLLFHQFYPLLFQACFPKYLHRLYFTLGNSLKRKIIPKFEVLLGDNLIQTIGNENDLEETAYI